VLDGGERHLALVSAMLESIPDELNLNPPPSMPLEVSNFEKRQHFWKFCSSEFVTLQAKNRLWNKQGVFWKTIQVQSRLCLSQLYLARHLRLSVFRPEFGE